MVLISCDECKHFVIRTHELDFQQRNLDPSTIKLMFTEFKSLLPFDRIILAIDAYKNENSTAIVAINCSSDVVIKGTIHNINFCVFWGEPIYSPEHVGIAENERADSLTKKASTSPNICDWISPEDARSAWFKILREKQNVEWENSKYYDKYRWLYDSNFKKLNLSRRNEVLIFRLISRTLQVNAILHKCQLTDSPNCIHCQVQET
ncbi:hypothetical protein AVEN_11675-1 [Araneus ventricosus]|uniref:RNase H type-1 domain-containing protein n=1 Tax=Araneus ventricosus TaxID=182803 RepID=A0A4Y2K4M1_ARAVE|nr:hypothetical protein AVEN_11675-1 [Araneus ventricosus]